MNQYRQYRYAIEFDFIKNENGDLHLLEPKYDNHILISELPWMKDSFVFDMEYWDWWKDEINTPSLTGLISGKYHVFEFGSAFMDGGYTEYGWEANGWVCEPEIRNIWKFE